MIAFNIILYLGLLSGSVQSTDLNENYVSLHDIASRHGFPAPKVSQNTISFKKKGFSMEFTSDSRKILLNNILLWMNEPTATSKKNWAIHNADAHTIIAPFLRPARYKPRKKPELIVLDPGHGGKDLGAVGSLKQPEKTLALDIAKRIKRKLIAKNIKVRLTRDSDQYVALAKRSSIATELKADLFVSIHLNFAENKKATGLETYTTTPTGLSSTSRSKPDNTVHSGNKYDPVNTIFAYMVHSEILKQTDSADRGIKHARFNVLRDAPCPAILLEYGFLSNRSDEAKLVTEEYRERIADGTARGILEYIRQCSK
jgi:N-acetylmuramoyl-L-alanine amidase